MPFSLAIFHFSLLRFPERIPDSEKDHSRRRQEDQVLVHSIFSRVVCCWLRHTRQEWSSFTCPFSVSCIWWCYVHSHPSTSCLFNKKESSRIYKGVSLSVSPTPLCLSLLTAWGDSSLTLFRWRRVFPFCVCNFIIGYWLLIKATREKNVSLCPPWRFEMGWFLRSSSVSLWTTTFFLLCFSWLDWGTSRWNAVNSFTLSWLEGMPSRPQHSLYSTVDLQENDLLRRVVSLFSFFITKSEDLQMGCPCFSSPLLSFSLLNIRATRKLQVHENEQ